MIVRIAAATGKVRPLARPEVLDITPSGFRVCRGQMDICEQSTSPKIELRRLLENADGIDFFAIPTRSKSRSGNDR